MGRLYKLYAWFRDSQLPSGAPRGSSYSRAEIEREHALAKSREALRVKYDEPHYYVLDFAWKQVTDHPKTYFGPFKKQAEAQAVMLGEKKKYPGHKYRVRRLSADQFEEIWGSPPGGGY